MKIYYDNGQRMVTAALHSALDFILSKDAVLYRMASAREYRLSQVADCICTLKPTDVKFQRSELTETDAKVFGTNHPAFRKNHCVSSSRFFVTHQKTARLPAILSVIRMLDRLRHD